MMHVIREYGIHHPAFAALTIFAVAAVLNLALIESIIRWDRHMVNKALGRE